MSDEVSLTLSTSNTQTLFSEEGGGMVVRRLTPRECERLQGFPDDWTKIPYRGKPARRVPRWASIQGDRQQHGRPRDAVDRREDRHGRGG